MKKLSFTVKGGVPIPEKGTASYIKGRKNSVERFVYPFKEMDIGDSFQFRLEDMNRVTVNAFNSLGKGNFKVRKINQTFGRLWRSA